MNPNVHIYSEELSRALEEKYIKQTIVQDQPQQMKPEHVAVHHRTPPQKQTPTKSKNPISFEISGFSLNSTTVTFDQQITRKDGV